MSTVSPTPPQAPVKPSSFQEFHKNRALSVAEQAQVASDAKQAAETPFDSTFSTSDVLDRALDTTQAGLGGMAVLAKVGPEYLVLPLPMGTRYRPGFRGHTVYNQVVVQVGDLHGPQLNLLSLGTDADKIVQRVTHRIHKTDNLDTVVTAATGAFLPGLAGTARGGKNVEVSKLAVLPPDVFASVLEKLKEQPDGTIGLPPTAFLAAVRAVDDVDVEHPHLLSQAIAMATGIKDPAGPDKPSPMCVDDAVPVYCDHSVRGCLIELMQRLVVVPGEGPAAGSSGGGGGGPTTMDPQYLALMQLQVDATNKQAEATTKQAEALEGLKKAKEEKKKDPVESLLSGVEAAVLTLHGAPDRDALVALVPALKALAECKKASHIDAMSNRILARMKSIPGVGNYGLTSVPVRPALLDLLLKGRPVQNNDPSKPQNLTSPLSFILSGKALTRYGELVQEVSNLLDSEGREATSTILARMKEMSTLFSSLDDADDVEEALVQNLAAHHEAAPAHDLTRALAENFKEFLKKKKALKKKVKKGDKTILLAPLVYIHVASGQYWDAWAQNDTFDLSVMEELYALVAAGNHSMYMVDDVTEFQLPAALVGDCGGTLFGVPGGPPAPVGPGGGGRGPPAPPPAPSGGSGANGGGANGGGVGGGSGGSVRGGGVGGGSGGSAREEHPNRDNPPAYVAELKTILGSRRISSLKTEVTRSWYPKMDSGNQMCFVWILLGQCYGGDHGCRLRASHEPRDLSASEQARALAFIKRVGDGPGSNNPAQGN